LINTKVIYVIFLLCLASVQAFTQDADPVTYLSVDEMKQMIVVTDFPDVPSEVRAIPEQGIFFVHVRINEMGQPVRVGPHAKGPGKYEFFREYVQKAGMDWTFKPLIIDGQPRPYRGLYLLQFLVRILLRALAQLVLWDFRIYFVRPGGDAAFQILDITFESRLLQCLNRPGATHP
jgi:hypothetical protein